MKILGILIVGMMMLASVAVAQQSHFVPTSADTSGGPIPAKGAFIFDGDVSRSGNTFTFGAAGGSTEYAGDGLSVSNDSLHVTAGIGISTSGDSVLWAPGELVSFTMFAGAAASYTVTADVTGTDAVITFGDGVVNVSTGILQEGGAAVWTALADMALTKHYIYVGDANGHPAAVAMSGDATIDSSGALAVVDDSHNHTIGNVDGLQDSLTAKWDALGDMALAKANIYVGNADGDPAAVAMAGDATIDSAGNVTVTDDSHNHIIGNVDGLQDSLTIKWDALGDMVLDSAYIYVGNDSDDPVAVAVSGDVTITTAGAITLTATAVDSGNIGNDALAMSDINWPVLYYSSHGHWTIDDINRVGTTSGSKSVDYEYGFSHVSNTSRPYTKISTTETAPCTVWAMKDIIVPKDLASWEAVGLQFGLKFDTTAAAANKVSFTLYENGSADTIVAVEDTTFGNTNWSILTASNTALAGVAAGDTLYAECRIIVDGDLGGGQITNGCEFSNLTLAYKP